MTKYREILRLHCQGISNRSIAVSLECSRNTVRKVLERAEEEHISWPLPESVTDRLLEQRLFGRRAGIQNRKMPDWEYVHQELAHAGVTLSLLWNDYCENCRMEGSYPLMYTQFCYHYQQFAVKNKATLHTEHKPGDRMEVDWAGDTASIQDNITRKSVPVSVFVAVLSSSGYAYAEGFLARDLESWISAHVNAYQFFAGSTRMLVPDNLKTGVVKADWYSPVINKTYHELAEYYGTAVIPAGVRKPREKALVERTVGILSTWIIAALRISPPICRCGISPCWVLLRTVIGLTPSSLLRFALKTPKNRRLGDFLPCKLRSNQRFAAARLSWFLRHKVTQKPTSATGC